MEAVGWIFVHLLLSRAFVPFGLATPPQLGLYFFDFYGKRSENDTWYHRESAAGFGVYGHVRGRLEQVVLANWDGHGAWVLGRLFFVCSAQQNTPFFPCRLKIVWTTERFDLIFFWEVGWCNWAVLCPLETRNGNGGGGGGLAGGCVFSSAQPLAFRLVGCGEW